MKAAFPAFVSERDCWSLAEGVALAESEGFTLFDGVPEQWATLRNGVLEALVQKNPHKKHLAELILPFVVHIVQMEAAF